MNKDDEGNVTHMINRKTLGLDQLEGFDSNGDPGPGVTFESALAEVKRLAAEVKSLKSE